MKILTICSLILLAVVIGCQAHSGMYDVHAVTTSDVQQDWKSWVGREVRLSNVSIRKYDIREEGADTFVVLWLVNGRTNPPDSENALVVLGKMSSKEAGKVESLPWYLRNGTHHLSSARVAIKNELAVLKEYSLAVDTSWFSSPYVFTVNTINRFASLAISVWAGVAIQAVVYLVIAAMVVMGMVIVIPDA